MQHGSLLHAQKILVWCLNGFGGWAILKSVNLGDLAEEPLVTFCGTGQKKGAR
jgi:hypothetical protein